MLGISRTFSVTSSVTPKFDLFCMFLFCMDKEHYLMLSVQ